MPKANKNDDLMKENDASAAQEERTAEIPEAPPDNKPPEGAPAKVPKRAKVPDPAKVPERVDIFIPRAGVNEEPVLTVGINGVMYRLPRGKTSNVPKFVADEIKRSWEAASYMDEHSNDMQDQMLNMARSVGLIK